MTLINESDLYSLILSSKLPAAKKFRHWVTSEVLPRIRQTSGYVQARREQEFTNNYLSNLSDETKKLIVRDLKNTELENEKTKLDERIKSNNEALIQLEV